MVELTLEHKRRLGNRRYELDEKDFYDSNVPSETDPVVQALAAELSDELPRNVPGRPDPRGVYGWPADGIREKIKADAGSIRFGWRLRELADVLLTANSMRSGSIPKASGGISRPTCRSGRPFCSSMTRLCGGFRLGTASANPISRAVPDGGLFRGGG